MGSSPSKPEFVTVLADKQVTIGDDVILRCQANTEELTATWEKNDLKLFCVEGKHSSKQIGKSFDLKIRNTDEGDEGKYTIHLNNASGSTSFSAMVTVELNEWRKVQWNQAEMINTLQHFRISNENVKELLFLLHGPIGSGKSSIINTIKTIFGGRVYLDCPTASEITESSKSHTLKYEKFQFQTAENQLLPFAFNDAMGVEKSEGNGVHCDDVINVLKGHIKEGYAFNTVTPIMKDNPYYLRNPDIKDKIHCLVNVIPADTLAMIRKDDFINKMKTVAERARRMGVLQVVLLTRVDRACPLTNKDLHNVYKSKKIKDKMRECSVLLGVPMNLVFPVYNYHEEIEINENINCLMLHALSKIVQWADDYIVRYSKNPTLFEEL